MKLFLLAACTGLIVAVVGCADRQPVNVAKDADAAKIEEYNRLTEEAEEIMAEDEASDSE